MQENGSVPRTNLGIASTRVLFGWGEQRAMGWKDEGRGGFNVWPVWDLCGMSETVAEDGFTSPS